MATPDDAIGTALSAVLRLDREGRLDEAKAELERIRLTLDPATPARARSELLRLGARVLRHRHDQVSLGQARNAAGSALGIALAARKPDKAAVTLAALEIAACDLALGDLSGAGGRAALLRDDNDPAIAGWAELIVARARLAEGRHFPAIAALHNAIAEHRRERNDQRVATARLWLAVALDDAGRVDEARSLLDEDRARWTGEPGVRRVSVLHRLTAATNARSRGEIQEALHMLAEAREFLTETSGMNAERARMHRLRADCYEEWGQRDEAERERARARRAQPPAMTASQSAPRFDQPSSPQAPRALARRSRQRASVSGPRLDDEVLGVLDGLGEDQVRGRIGVRFVVDQCECLQGVSGYERDEVYALFEGARRLDPADGEAAFWRERLLRRAEARLGFLPGLDILWGRVRIQLAGLLAEEVGADADRREEARHLVVDALLQLDRERFDMATRSWRARWLEVEIGPAYDLAIRLAVAVGDKSLARDLIIRSRVAGVVSPSGEIQHRRPRVGDLPLVPPPRFTYLDGTESTPGDGAPCLFV